MRSASLARSPTSAWDSSEAFTNVPMPPFQNMSTGARRIAWQSSVGGRLSASMPSAARACGESGTPFAERGQTPPPSLISALS